MGGEGPSDSVESIERLDTSNTTLGWLRFEIDFEGMLWHPLRRQQPVVAVMNEFEILVMGGTCREARGMSSGIYIVTGYDVDGVKT